jgi:hypothetical protein
MTVDKGVRLANFIVDIIILVQQKVLRQQG